MMTWWQKFTEKHFGYKYALFTMAIGVLRIDRYCELENGVKVVKSMNGTREMLKDGTIDGDYRYNGDYVKWRSL